MDDIVSVVKDIATILTPVAVAGLAILAHRTKLAWSKEFSQLREEVIKSKDEQIKTWRDRLEFTERLVSKALWDDVQNQKVQLETRITEMKAETESNQKTVKEQEQSIHQMKQALNELPGKSEQDARDKLLHRMGRELDIMGQRADHLREIISDQDWQLSEKEKELAELKSRMEKSKRLTESSGGSSVYDGDSLSSGLRIT